MNFKQLSIALLLSLLAAAGAAQPVVHYRIEAGHPLQTMEHFGASDAWSMQHIGLWPTAKRNQVADWLFSMKTDKHGRPLGIGLSMWRFNVGAGSAQQGDESQIGSVWTRTECLLRPDGTYDWSRQQGERNMLKLAKERGVGTFLAFLNSPPVYFTQNGLATNTGRGGTANLKPDCYGSYARFLADVVEGIERHDGVRFDYICPFNEPDGHWNWTGPKQEGTPATNREVAAAVRRLSREFVGRGIETRILVNESSDYRCMFRTHETDWQRGYQIQAFFCPDSVDTYLGDVPGVPRLMVGHSYWTNTPLEALRGIRCQLRDTLDKYGVDFWQTETCIMGNDEEIGGGGGFDPTMKTALYVARIIHHDIVCAGARAWHWWRAVGGDYKDGLLYMGDAPGLRDGRVEDSKLLWTLGNYSRFVRPGAVRMAVHATDGAGRAVPEGDTDPTGLMCSAYRNRDGRWAVVLINYADEEKFFTLEVDADASAVASEPSSASAPSAASSVATWQAYRTSDRTEENLLPVGRSKSGQRISIPARSVMTFVSE